MLQFYRAALALRRTEDALRHGDLRWRSVADAAVLHFARGDGFRCLVNLSGEPAALPDRTQVVLASGPLTGGGTMLPPDTAVWLRI